MQIMSEWFCSDSSGSLTNTGSTSGLGPETIFRYFTFFRKNIVKKKTVKNCQNQPNMWSTMWNESNYPNLRKKKFPAYAKRFFSEQSYDSISLKLYRNLRNFSEENVIQNTRAPEFDRKLNFFTDKGRISLIRVL